jgi:hypothetical protein
MTTAGNKQTQSIDADPNKEHKVSEEQAEKNKENELPA